jgi:hypothetical protein
MKAALLLLRSLMVIAPVACAAAGPDFERDVAPIFEARCLSCHDGAHSKGDLKLDTREHALAVMVPGKPEKSRLIEQVSGPKPEMPKKGEPLSPAEVETLRRWIAAGAPWHQARVLKDNPPRNLDWWSLKPLAIQSPKSKVQGRNPVDTFVDAKLAERGLKPVAPADAATLVRRMTFDLTGLPPTPAEVEAFVQDSIRNPNSAIRTLADRLLASPAFGEKWARHWLDVARYGETHGYDKDKPRMNAWPYRDYVIRAFNEDKPYDRFVQEQIAGDALFPGQPDGVLGLGFLAAGPWDFIGHTEVGEAKLDGRIAKHLDRDEMVSAVFNVFLSTTVQCAQCHHHKFDPVKMEDYYRLHAVFAAVDRADRVYAGLPPGQERERNDLVARINALRAEKDSLDTGLKRAIAARTSGLDRRIAELKQKHGSPLRPQYGWHSAVSRTSDAMKWVQVDLGAPRGVDEVRLIPAFDQFNNIGAGFGFPVRYKVEAANDAEFKQGVRLLFDGTQADQPNPKTREAVVDVGGAPVRFIRVTATRLAPRRNDFIFALGELEAVGGDLLENFARGAAVTSLDSIEGAPRWGRANLTDGIFHRELGDPGALAELRKLEDERAAIEAQMRPPETVARLKAIEEELPKLTQQLEAIPKGELVYAAATDFSAQGRFIATGGKPRAIHLLSRGDLKAPGELMRPGTAPLWPGAPMEFALPANATEADARAALARVITSRDNPLLWRSIVNRLWQWTFGQPLVGTPNDFGRMGLKPTHPELLDFLAAKLRDDPQHSLKAIIRLLVTSEAYRRASTYQEANARLDANNTLLWRANRRRLSAEEFRDAVLAVSGTLRTEQRGGPSFMDFVIEKPQHSPHYQYHLHDPDDPASHRRSIYRFIVRSQPQPLMTTLDCADPSLSVAARDESTTALQALAQWNNRLVETMSRHFAARLDQTAKSSEDKVNLACRLALGRAPDAAEARVLREHLQAHGSASLARVIFNLNSFVYVD